MLDTILLTMPIPPKETSAPVRRSASPVIDATRAAESFKTMSTPSPEQIAERRAEVATENARPKRAKRTRRF